MEYQDFTGKRVVEINYVDGTAAKHTDSWKEAPYKGAASMEKLWTGRTVLSIKPRREVSAPLEPKSDQCLVYDMRSFLQQCVEKYGALAGIEEKKLKVAPTPFLDDSSSSESEEKGQLSSVAAKVLMKLLYAARMCRYDLLRAICSLAQMITKWSKSCDATPPAHGLCQRVTR